MARRKRAGRALSGILILDKPLEISSNIAVQRVKRHFFAAKAGHTGSLDPMATGVLPICLGHATKISSFLLASDKGYRFVMRLGQTTTTGDVEGDVIEEKPIPDISEQQLLQICQDFQGNIQQIPPMYSALKHNGQRLYALARKGEVVDRPPRDIEIKSIKLVAQDAQTLTFDVVCTKGTYIRTLAEDIGLAIGCGAHLIFLRRTLTGPFDIENAITLEQLEACDGDYDLLDKHLQCLDVALQDFPEVVCNEEQKSDLCMGRKIAFDNIPNNPIIRLYDEQGAIFGMAKENNLGQLAPTKIFN